VGSIGCGIDINYATQLNELDIKMCSLSRKNILFFGIAAKSQQIV